ncbi:MAG TPA: ABC transporter permease, partial [Caulobacteraceae bacterium]|nr:ABC transporter permease [Caulobacteraceae bacterium]
MNLLGQIWTTTKLALEALPQRIGPALVTVLGVAVVVAVMVSILAIGSGVRHFIDVNDQPARAVILSAATPSEYAGSFDAGQIAIIESAPGIKRLPDGRPMVQPTSAALVLLTRKADGVPGYGFLRGASPMMLAMSKSSLHIVAGRLYRSGLRELVVGRGEQEIFRGLDLGDQVMLHGAPWRVVGVYEDEGGIDETAMAGDVDMVRADIGSPTYQSVQVMLNSAADFGRFRDALMSNPQLNVQVKRLTDYYRGQMGQLLTLFDFVGYFVGGLMAIGAICGAVTTLYAAVDARAREIATLRAIGFSGSAVVASVMLEALALAIPGALIGLA